MPLGAISYPRIPMYSVGEGKVVQVNAKTDSVVLRSGTTKNGVKWYQVKCVRSNKGNLNRMVAKEDFEMLKRKMGSKAMRRISGSRKKKSSGRRKRTTRRKTARKSKCSRKSYKECRKSKGRCQPVHSSKRSKAHCRSKSRK